MISTLAQNNAYIKPERAQTGINQSFRPVVGHEYNKTLEPDRQSKDPRRYTRKKELKKPLVSLDCQTLFWWKYTRYSVLGLISIQRQIDKETKRHYGYHSSLSKISLSASLFLSVCFACLQRKKCHFASGIIYLTRALYALIRKRKRTTLWDPESSDELHPFKIS